MTKPFGKILRIFIFFKSLTKNENQTIIKDMDDKKAVPPIIPKRNEYGLIASVNYVFNDEGFIDWRKMVKPEFLVANRQNFERRKQAVPNDIKSLEDKDLLILLGGIKELAQIRGFSNVNFNPKTPSSDYVVSVCSITWTPNYETEGKEVVFSAIGDASPNNTSSFFRNYLGQIAENRSFVRCVRNFLKINVVSQEEIGGGKTYEESVSNDFNPKVLLSQIMREKNVSFESIKSKLLKENFEGADLISSVQEIPNIKVFELIERLQKLKG